jgi:hypothetical protein
MCFAGLIPLLPSPQAQGETEKQIKEQRQDRESLALQDLPYAPTPLSCQALDKTQSANRERFLASYPRRIALGRLCVCFSW